jgi:hypothetical protein
MKKSIMMPLLLGFGVMSCAQSTPSAVKSTFAKKFPNAKSVEWEKENDSEWEAEFKINEVEYSANFSNDGTWKETEHEIKESELPNAVKNTLDNQFGDYKVEEVELIETPEFSGYEIELEKGEETIELVIDNSGKVLKKKVETESEEKDEY